MNKKVTLKDIAIMQSGIYMKTDSQGEDRYLQVKDVNSENKLDYTQIATVINTLLVFTTDYYSIFYR